MKNFVLATALIIVFSAILEMYLPWWIIAPVGFATGFIVQQKSGITFLSGFLAIFVLWAGYAFALSHANNDILARKIAQLLMLKGHVSLLLLITGFVGGLVSGFGALSGRWAAELR